MRGATLHLIVLVVVLCSGCDAILDNSGSGNATTAPSASVLADDAVPVLTVHERFAELAKAAPGFGGIYLDEGERPHVLLTDPDERESALRVLQELSVISGDGRIYTTSLALRNLDELEAELQIVEAEYDYTQLYEAYQQVTDVLGGLSGFLGADISSWLNRIVVTVEDGADGAAGSLLAPLGLPAGMVVFKQGAPLVLDATLSSTVRPVAGGLRVANAVCGFFQRNGPETPGSKITGRLQQA